MRKFWSKQWILGSILLSLTSQSVAMDLQSPQSILTASGGVYCQEHFCVLRATVTNQGRVPFNSVWVSMFLGKCGNKANNLTYYPLGDFGIAEGETKQINMEFSSSYIPDLVNTVCIRFSAVNGFVDEQYSFTVSRLS